MNMKENLNNDDNPYISIIVPIYNTNNIYLEKCINSLLNQSVPNIEIILVDDGSKVEINDFCKQYVTRDNRVVLFTKQNEGVSSARNFGLEKSNGKYIMFVDSDDWIEKDTCELALKTALENNADLVYWNYVKDLPNGSQKKVLLGNFKSIYNMQILGSSCMKLYKRECLEGIRFNICIKNGEDVEFNLRTFKKIKNAKYMDSYSYHYVIHEHSAVRKYDNNMIDNYKNTLKYMQENCNNDNEYKVYYTFSAISYLMILMNFIVTKNNSKSFRQKIGQIRKVSSDGIYGDMFKNIKKVELPFTRKATIYCSKFRLYLFSYLIIRIKLVLDGRK